jgi:Cd2+/Zn2+-exporting ATPase
MKEFILQGLSCADCAAGIERSVKELEGVSYASVNFLTTTLRIEIAGNYSAGLQKKVESIVHQHEPDVLVLEKTNFTQMESRKPGKAKIARPVIRLSAGAVILAAGMALERFFQANEYVAPAVFVFGYLLLGGEIILRAARNIARGKVFDENFLMTAATIGAFAIGEYAEGVGVMLFYQVGEFFQDLAVRKSRKNIAELMDIRPDFANLRTDSGLKKVAPEIVQKGDVIVVKPGEKIPLDGVVIEGESSLDASALTGESVPRKAFISDTVLSGCINQNGVLTIKVTQTFGESTASKIIDLVENAAGKKAPTENFITKFARYYTPAVVGLAALIALIPPLIFGGAWSGWFSRALIFLVISCPCALVISIPLGFFGGIGGASKRGILIKGGNYLEALNDLDLVVFDKTGTLTKGVFKVTAIIPSGGFSEGELLEAAAEAEAFSNHPIALSIMREYGKAVDKSGLTKYSEIAGHGVSVNAGGRTILAGNEKLMVKMGVAFEETQNIGTRVYIAADGLFMGCVVISDEIKPDSRDAIAALKALGVGKTVMLTGDNPRIAEAIAKDLKLDEAYGGLLPQQKVEKLEMLNGHKRPKRKLAFVGDGINDAPVLAMADIGVAMGGLGSDAAIEAADVVLMTDEPSKLVEAIEIARFTKRIVRQNIVFALGVKTLFLLSGALGVAGMWEAVFADVGVAVLAILNAMRVMKYPG